MSVALHRLCEYLEQCLQPARFADYCPNGLQVEGRAQVARLVTGVTACQALLDAAIEWGADAILVHHGYFWRGESPQVVGMKRRRLATLLAHDVSLLAYHLPLDAHPQMGNNARLGELMGLDLECQAPLQPQSTNGVGNICDLPQAVAASQLVSRLAAITGRQPLHVGDPDATVRRIAWCTGAAQDYIAAARTCMSQVKRRSKLCTQPGRRGFNLSLPAITPLSATAYRRSENILRAGFPCSTGLSISITRSRPGSATGSVCFSAGF